VLLGLSPEIVEEFATLANRVELALTGASRRAVLVGSPVRNSGVSTVAVGLAATLATTSKGRMLLVDANLRQPSLHGKFNLAAEPGLTDLVHGRASEEAVIRSTAVPRLDLIVAGSAEGSPHSFFQSPAFRDHLARWTTDYNYVILDSAPFGAVAEPLTLAQNASGVVLVVEAARTAREVAAELVDKLRESGVRVLGAVLNKRKFYIPEWIYRRV
jgi:capsular exopolysaccharide synthesis family protein